MSNFFKQASSIIRTSSMVIPAWLVFAAMLVISICLGIEDYTTSLLGYQMIPTQKANTWVIPMVALLPQVGQIGFSLVFMFDTKKRWAALIGFLLFAADLVSDTWFKTNGMKMGFGTLAFSLGETLILYTIGSEVMLAVSFGMVIELFPDFIAKCSELSSRLFETLAKSEDEKPPAAQTPQRPAQTRMEEMR